MAYSERINTYLTRLSAVTNANFEKKRLTDIINRLLKPDYKLSIKEAEWINRTCKIWLGANTSIATGYALTSRQRQTLRRNTGSLNSNISGKQKSNVAGNVAKNAVNVTGNVAGKRVNVIGNVGFNPSNVISNVASTSFKPAYSLSLASPIVNKVIVNSQYSQYAPPLTSPPNEDVADDMTGPSAACPIDVADAMLDGLAEANVGFASSSLDEIDAAKATSCSTLGASATAFATSGLDQKTQPHIPASPRSATPVGNDNGHVGQDEIKNGRDAQQRGGVGARHAGAAAKSAAPPLQISATALLVGTSTVQVSIWTDRMPMGKGIITFGKRPTYVYFQPASTHGASLLGRIAGDAQWEREIGEMFKQVAAGSGGVSGLYLDETYQSPIKNTAAMMFYDDGKPSLIVVDVPGWCDKIGLAQQPSSSKGPQYKGAWKREK